MVEKKEQNKEKKTGARFNIGKQITETNYQTLVEPWITEKSHELMVQNKYVFKVLLKSDKGKISSAVENLYNVKVKSVNVVNIHPKKRRYGKSSGVKQGFKKAIITLVEGNKIELFEGA